MKHTKKKNQHQSTHPSAISNPHFSLCFSETENEIENPHLPLLPHENGEKTRQGG
jgi:hypothetical protein